MSTGNVRKADWTEINSFITRECTDIIGYGFNPYDYAVAEWGKNKIGNRTPVADLLNTTKSLALSVVGEYVGPLEENARTYTRKCELSKEISDFMINAKQTVTKYQTKFAVSPVDIKTKWLKTIKKEREIELFDQIELLMTAPAIVHSRIEQGKIVDAAQHICKAISIYEKENFYEINSLVTVKARLDECRKFMVDHVINSLFSELFVDTVPEGVSFFKSSPDQVISLPAISVNKIRKYSPLLITLDIQSDFTNLLKDQVKERLASLMSQTADAAKNKKTRQYVQTKDGFEELVDIASSYTLNHPLVSFVNQLLGKMWVLLARCNELDQIIGQGDGRKITFRYAFEEVKLHMREIIQTFTSTQGSKEEVNDEKLEFHFLSCDTTPTNGTASALRTELGIKPCYANSIHIFPMMDDFFDCVKKKFNENSPLLSIRSTIDHFVRVIFADQAKAISSNIDVTRPVKTEYHSVPVLISTPILIENMEKFISIASKFPYLQQKIIQSTIAFLSEFNERCSHEIIEGNSDKKLQQEEIWSNKLLNDKSLPQYLAQYITTQLVINKSNENLEDRIKELADIEEANEAELMSGNVILTVENTVRLRFHLPQVAAIAESLVVLSDNLRKFMDIYTLSEQSKSSIGKLLDEFKITIVKAMAFIRIEMRCRTYADIVQQLMNGNYSSNQITSQPDQYVTDFISNFTNSCETMRPCLTPERFTFVFIGIPRLVYDIHIRFVPRLREINDKGAIKLTTNLSAINQAFASLQYPEIPIYKKALALVSNISYSAARILLQIEQMKDLFTYEEMEPVFNMQQKMDEKHEENLEKLRQLLKK